MFKRNSRNNWHQITSFTPSMHKNLEVRPGHHPGSLQRPQPPSWFQESFAAGKWWDGR